MILRMIPESSATNTFMESVSSLSTPGELEGYK